MLDGLGDATREIRGIVADFGRAATRAFEAAPQHAYLVRSVDPVEPPLAVPDARYIEARGPFNLADERKLLEREKIEGEYRELTIEIVRLEEILADPRVLMKVIRDELTEMRTLYGDPEGKNAGTGAPSSGGSRRTEIVEAEDDIEPMDLVADESMVVMLTGQGYIKRLPTEDYRVQARGGKMHVGIQPGPSPQQDRADMDQQKEQQGQTTPALPAQRPTQKCH